MTPEQLDEIEKLAERTIKLRGEGADPPAERTLALVKAVREAKAELEEQREIIEWMKTATLDAGGDTTLSCSFCGAVETLETPIFFIALAKRVMKQRKQHAACRLPKEGEA